MAAFERMFYQELKKPLEKHPYEGIVFSADNESTVVGVELYKDGEPATLTGSVVVYAIRGDGNYVIFPGTLSGNVASATLPQACFAVPGHSLAVMLQIVSGGVKTTVLKIGFMVAASTTGAPIDPGSVVPDISDLLAMLDDMAAATAAANTAAENAEDATDYIAPTETSPAESAHSVGEYIIYNGAVYHVTAAIAIGDTLTVGTNIAVDPKGLGGAVSGLKKDLAGAVSELNDDIAGLNDDVTVITQNEVLRFTEKKAINTSENASLSFQTDNDSNCIKIACSAGDKFTISGEGWVSFALWSFYGAESNGTYPRLSYSGTNASANRDVITAPTGTAILVVNVKRVPSYYAGFLCAGIYLQNRLTALEDAVDTVISNKPDIKDSNATNVDLDVSDESGNVIARFADGSIKVKDFDSGNVGDLDDLTTTEKSTLVGAINEVEGNTEDNAEDIETLEGEIENIGEELALLPEGKDTTEETVDLDITDEDGNVILRLQDGHIQTKEFNSADVGNDVYTMPITQNDDLVLCDIAGNAILTIYNGNLKTKRFDSIQGNPNVVKVRKDGNGDYTSIRAAIESITDASVNNPYVIEVYEGTYNVLDDYTQTEIEDTDFFGPMLTEGMTLRGIGNRDNVIIYGYLDPDTYNQTTRNRIATLNTVSECGMENLTVVGEKIRYAVHDDYVDAFHIIYGRNPKRMIRNCVFIGKQTTGVASYGAGTSNARDYIFDNCIFPTERIGIHMQVGMSHSCELLFTNCYGVGLSLGDYSTAATSPKHTAMLNGCDFKTVELYKANNGSYTAQHMRVVGTGCKNALFNVPAGFVYQTGDVVTTTTALTLGDAVTADYDTATAGTVYGVCIGTYEGLSYVQRSGYILASLLGLTANAGDYAGISNGSVIIQNTATNAIGKVAMFNNKAYIKLMI